MLSVAKKFRRLKKLKYYFSMLIFQLHIKTLILFYAVPLPEILRLKNTVHHTLGYSYVKFLW
jgi:hypothetical protein